MNARDFNVLLSARMAEGKFLCVGLDVDYDRMPARYKTTASAYMAMTRFNHDIICKTAPFAAAFKPNFWFYFKHGTDGMALLRNTVQFVLSEAPGVPIILDFKGGDIGNTADAAAFGAFQTFRVDAVTVNPYMGFDAVFPFARYPDKGIFVLCLTSNESAEELQRTMVRNDDPKLYLHPDQSHLPLYKIVATRAAFKWNGARNLGVVVGARHSNELREVREIVGRMPILVPGVGAQGGKIEDVVPAAKDAFGSGVLVNEGRSILYADDPAAAAEKSAVAIRSALGL